MAEIGSGDIFLEAREAFLASLSKPEQSLFKSCSSPDQLISEIGQIANLQSKHRVFVRPLDKLKALSDSLECYFKVVDIFVQSNPEISALVWGAIRLLLQLASNFGHFFNKLLDVLAKLGQKIPRYVEILKISPQSISEGFRRSLKNFYCDIFEFFTAVAKVFRRKDGELRRAIFVVADITLRPFETHYGNILDKVECHCNIMAEEQALLQTKAVLQTQTQQMTSLEMQDQSRKDSEQRYHDICQRMGEKDKKEAAAKRQEAIRRWLNPPRDQILFEALEKANAARLEGTATWIFSDPEFLSWESRKTIADVDGFQNALWIKGNPGTGKTVLASSTLRHFKDSHFHGTDQAIPATYFFLYKYEATRSPRTAWSLILSNILDHFGDDGDIVNAYSFAKKVSGEIYANTADLVGLLQMVAYRLPRLVFVIDGLDESSDPESLADSVASILHGTEAKAIFFSRPNVAVLQSNIKGSLRYIDLERGKVDADVRRLMETKLAQFQPEDLPTSWSTASTVSHLVECANGMILWAELMVTYLSQLEDTTARVEAIMSFTHHEDLDDMYIRILAHLAKRLRIERDMAKRVFLYLAYSDRHLNARELWEAVLHWNRPSTPPGTRGDISPTGSELEWFHSAVIIRCGSLVERRGLGYGFIHQSALEFFWTALQSDKAECQTHDIAQFLFQPNVAHNQLTVDCLTYLTTRIPGEPLSGDMRLKVERQKIENCLPFAAYAAVSWPKHLKAGAEAGEFEGRSDPRCFNLPQSFSSLSRVLSMFGLNKLSIMTWIELQYTVSDNIRHLDALEDWCTTVDSMFRNLSAPRETSATMRCLYKDLKELDLNWGPTLQENPYFIWGDITAFFASRFLQKTAATTVYSMEPVRISDQTQLHSDPLVLISRESGDKRLNAVLSIWPTQEFGETWTTSFKPQALNQENLFTGWMALFEKHDKRSDPLKKVAEIRITLEPKDIEKHLQTLLVRRSLFGDRISRTERSVSSTWSLAFPMAIAAQLNIFLVLGTAYILDDDRDGSSAVMESPRIRLSLRLPEVQGPHAAPKSSEKGKRKVRPPGLTEISLAFSYSYQIRDDGRYILRQEEKCLTTVDAAEPIICALSVFAIDENTQQCTLLGQFGSRESATQLACCSFHPSLPLILFHTRTFGGPQTVQLWSFDSTTSHDAAHHNSQSGITKSLVHTTSTPCPALLRRIEKLGFSACGRNAIVQCAGQELPDVYPLEMDHIFQAVLQATQTSHAYSVTTHPEEPIHALVQAGQQGGALMAPGKGLELGQPLLRGSFAETLTLSTSSTTKRTLDVVGSFGGISTARQHILSFPDSWQGIDRSVQASVEASRGRENHLDITINQSSKAWYNAGESGKTTPNFRPFLARKHIGAMLPVERIGGPAGTAAKRSRDMIDDGFPSDGFFGATRVKQQRFLGPAGDACTVGDDFWTDTAPPARPVSGNMSSSVGQRQPSNTFTMPTPEPD